MMRLLLALLLVLPSLAQALESAPVRSARAVATLVAEVDQAAPGQPFRLGLRLRLAPGWHSYWQNAGDAGAAPEVQLTLPQGWQAGALQFPTPERIATPPLMSFGYTGEVLLPLPVTPGNTPGAIEAEATWLVCADICIPEEGKFRLELPLGATPRPDAARAPLFTRAEAALPRPSPWPAAAQWDRTGATLVVQDPALAREAVKAAEFYPEATGWLDNPAPQRFTARDGTLRLDLPLAKDATRPAQLAGLLVLTDAAGVRAGYRVQAAITAAPPSLPLWQALAFALLGGLILNLMPCVFPILAMKAMALLRLSGAARAEVRAHALSYTAGVVVCFLALGGLLLALKGAGLAAGWGFQFTAPAFVAGMSWLMLAVALNLVGVFAVPGVVTGDAGRGHAGSFLTGALAVLAATPCTAPFMAAALGAALAMPAIGALAVFFALGVGLAAPYALLAAFPALARRLPRPGAWMEWLRQALAFPMFGAAAWLAWVLSQQAGPEGLAVLLAGAVLLGFAAWALGLAQRGGVRLARWGAAAAVLAALALLPTLRSAPPAAVVAEAGSAEPWSAARVAALQAEGKPVFVNMTAAWCISCKVNERLVLRTDTVQRAFAARGVATLVGDWTNGDATIAALLREHGRDGVPLYLLYPAGGGAPRLLPEVLTEGIVLRALEG